MTNMTARQRCALACLRINHPRANVRVLSEPRDKDGPKVKIKMTWSLQDRSREVWIGPDGTLELGVTRSAHAGRDRQRAAS
jgi:hypothetical protein